MDISEHIENESFSYYHNTSFHVLQISAAMHTREMNIKFGVNRCKSDIG